MDFTTFNGDAAIRWKEQMMELNDTAKTVLANVGSCLEEIEQESSGDTVSTMISQAKNESMTKFNDLVDSAITLVNAFADVVSTFFRFRDQAQEFIGDVIKTIVG